MNDQSAATKRREPCQHRHWLPLIVHRTVKVEVCLGCGEAPDRGDFGGLPGQGGY